MPPQVRILLDCLPDAGIANYDRGVADAAFWVAEDLERGWSQRVFGPRVLVPLIDMHPGRERLQTLLRGLVADIDGDAPIELILPYRPPGILEGEDFLLAGVAFAPGQVPRTNCAQEGTLEEVLPLVLEAIYTRREECREDHPNPFVRFRFFTAREEPGPAQINLEGIERLDVQREPGWDFAQVWEQRRKREEKARKRAEKLLLRHLNRLQRKEYKAYQYFETRGSDGNTYRIAVGDHLNVYRVEQGAPVSRYCVVPSQPVPVQDAMLSQKFAIETDVRSFEQIANIWDRTQDTEHPWKRRPPTGVEAVPAPHPPVVLEQPQVVRQLPLERVRPRIVVAA